MTQINNSSDPNYVAPGTVPPVVEAVEPARNNFRWLWWLLGLLSLAGVLWAVLPALLWRSQTSVSVTATPTVIEPPAVVETPALQGPHYIFNCEDLHFAVTVSPAGDSISALINGGVNLLANEVEAATGSRYEGEISAAEADDDIPPGPITLWNHGTDWEIIIGGQEIPCTNVG